MIPGSIQAVKYKRINIAVAEMKNRIGKAGTVFKFYFATNTQNGMSINIEQQ